MIKGDQKIVVDLASTVYEREAAEARIEQHEREKDWITTRLNATERDLGLQGEMSLWGKIKEIFKKYRTVTAICLAAGVTIGAVFGAIAKYVKFLGKDLADGLNELGKRLLLRCRADRSDRQLPFQSCGAGNRLSSRAYLALDFGGGCISCRNITQKAALTHC